MKGGVKFTCILLGVLSTEVVDTVDSCAIVVIAIAVDSSVIVVGVSTIVVIREGDGVVVPAVLDDLVHM